MDAYCISCLICQGDRVIGGKQQGELQPLSIPMNAFDVFFMDFITCLQESVASGDMYNSILMVVKNLSKMFHHILCRLDLTDRELVEVITYDFI